MDGIREILQIKAQKRTTITREGIRSMSTNQNLGYRDILSGMEELLDIYQNPEELDYDTFNLDD